MSCFRLLFHLFVLSCPILSWYGLALAGPYLAGLAGLAGDGGKRNVISFICPIRSRRRLDLIVEGSSRKHAAVKHLDSFLQRVHLVASFSSLPSNISCFPCSPLFFSPSRLSFFPSFFLCCTFYLPRFFLFILFVPFVIPYLWFFLPTYPLASLACVHRFCGKRLSCKSVEMERFRFISLSVLTLFHAPSLFLVPSPHTHTHTLHTHLHACTRTHKGIRSLFFLFFLLFFLLYFYLVLFVFLCYCTVDGPG